VVKSPIPDKGVIAFSNFRVVILHSRDKYIKQSHTKQQISEGLLKEPTGTSSNPLPTTPHPQKKGFSVANSDVLQNHKPTDRIS